MQSLCWGAALGLTCGMKAAKVEVFKWNSTPFGICGRRMVTAGQCSTGLGQGQPFTCASCVCTKHISAPALCLHAAPQGSTEEMQRSP